MAKNKKYQNAEELDAFIKMMRCEGVNSFLEIGSRFGGTLDKVGRSLPAGSRIVSVDIAPTGELATCVAQLCTDGYDAILVPGNSANPGIVATVKGLGPYDLVFIDGDHTAAMAWADWINYGPMGKIVAFHDIAWKVIPEAPNRMALHVAEVWNEIKIKYRHAEISMMAASLGIGILWKDA